jgi:hypothetical protein
MINKKLNKLVGLKKDDFDLFVELGQIQVQSARLIPTLKTGHEMSLTSIFLSAIKLIKEYRDDIFKEIKLSRGGKVFYYTEACFPEIDNSRIDGLIIIVIKGIISDAAFFEMKNKNNVIDKKQIEAYLSISRKLGVKKLVTVSNQFVADSSHSPIKIKVPKNISLLHFSWTYLITKGQLLLFKNETNISDEDQIEIMKEVLYYFENPISGITGYTQMKSGWKELSENIRAQKQLKITDEYIEDAVLSWYEAEKDIALLMSRKLGVLVKSSKKGKDSSKSDIKKIIKDSHITGALSVKNSVSEIKVHVDFKRRMVTMIIKVIPPLDKGTVARISWISRQLDVCRKKGRDTYQKIENDIWIEANVKYAKTNIKVKLIELGNLSALTKGKDIQSFQIVFDKGFGTRFSSSKLFIDTIKGMVLDYYEAIVQHLSNWKRPAPKIKQPQEKV